MPIVSIVERKSVKGRAMVAFFYALLALGGITMVYPFLLMLRLSTADTTDNNTLNVLPSFWSSNDSLAKKYMLRRYFGTAQNPYSPEVQPTFGAMPACGPDWTVSNYADLPGFWNTYFRPYGEVDEQGQHSQLADYRAFLRTLRINEFITVDWDPDSGFMTFKDFMENRMRLPKSARETKYLVRPDASIRDWHPHPDASLQISTEYKNWCKPEFRRPLYPPYVAFLKAKYGQFDVSKLNEAYHSHLKYWTEVRFPLAEPREAAQKADYREFVMKNFPHMWLHIKGDYSRPWQTFLIRDQKIKSPADWFKLTGNTVPNIASIAFPADLPSNEGFAYLWSAFVHANIRFEDRELKSPDRLYVNFLQSQYGTVEKLNQKWKTHHKNWSDVTFAEGLSDYRTLIDNAAAIRMGLTFHPYGVALNFLASQSTAVVNTAILMILSLVAALTVNPLAAYALSRFRVRGSHKILLFILATMALPAEISMVPSFLLVKNLGLMNNYLALILPGAASAYGIFLLKGFFDSLPAELYEAATLDGAKEMTIFGRITIPLAKPILAVTAMGAVLGAYGTFIPALLYLPNNDLWPIMPKLFSMSTQHDLEITFGVNMAALVIGSVPTFLVFLFAQRQIMRGIILPTFK